MMRGSSELLQRSLRQLVSVVECIAEQPEESWLLDVPNDEEGIDAVLALGDVVRDAFAVKATDVLVTKVLLGVFGCVPAFDQYFRKGFRTSGLSRRSLLRIGDFYENHRNFLDGYGVRTLDFATGAKTDRFYPGGKLVDMIFFQEGLNKAGKSGLS
jgi:hypothetical protein